MADLTNIDTKISSNSREIQLLSYPSSVVDTQEVDLNPTVLYETSGCCSRVYFQLTGASVEYENLTLKEVRLSKCCSRALALYSYDENPVTYESNLFVHYRDNTYFFVYHLTNKKLYLVDQKEFMLQNTETSFVKDFYSIYGGLYLATNWLIDNADTVFNIPSSIPVDEYLNKLFTTQLTITDESDLTFGLPYFSKYCLGRLIKNVSVASGSINYSD